MKVALVSPVLPPSPSGQANVLFHLLKSFDPAEYCLISHASYADALPPATEPLPAQTYRISLDRMEATVPPTLTSNKVTRLIAKLLSERWFPPWVLDSGFVAEQEEVRQRAAQIARIVHEEGCDLVIGTTGDLYDFPAAYLASKLAHVPFVAYLFDSYSGQWQFDRRAARVARAFEADCIRYAAAVIAPNEFLAREYREAYGVQAAIIRNPVAVAEVEAAAAAAQTFVPGTKNIVFSGSVYHINYDNFRQLSAALDQLQDDDVFLHIYTAQSASQVRKQGVQGGHVVLHGHLPHHEIWAVQKQADLLFLPLGFEETMRKIARTSAPGKLGEYLASGRPILVNAPPDAFVSWYFEQHTCGVVVDENTPAALSRAVKTILESGAGDMTRAAQQRAREDFDLPRVTRDFRAVLQSVLRQAE